MRGPRQPTRDCREVVREPSTDDGRLLADLGHCRRLPQLAAPQRPDGENVRLTDPAGTDNAAIVVGLYAEPERVVLRQPACHEPGEQLVGTVRTANRRPGPVDDDDCPT